MKTIITLLTLALVFSGTVGNGQTWNEWFRQKKTQKRYLAEQIAALHVYLDHLKKGYSIARKGLNTIENIKNGHFSLDRDFFASLKNVNPAIRNAAKIADIIAFEIFIGRELSKTYQFCSTNAVFTAEEIRYIAKVHSNLLFLTDASVSEFLIILKSGDREMTDDQRMERLNSIHDDLKDKCVFAADFGNHVKFISMERDRIIRESSVSRTINASNEPHQ